MRIIERWYGSDLKADVIFTLLLRDSLSRIFLSALSDLFQGEIKRISFITSSLSSSHYHFFILFHFWESLLRLSSMSVFPGPSLKICLKTQLWWKHCNPKSFVLPFHSFLTLRVSSSQFHSSWFSSLSPILYFFVFFTALCSYLSSISWVTRLYCLGLWLLWSNFHDTHESFKVASQSLYCISYTLRVD